MNLPVEWLHEECKQDGAKRPPAKKAKMSATERKKGVNNADNDEQSAVTVVIQNKLNHNVNILPLDEELRLDHIISGVPYKQIIREIYGEHSLNDKPEIPLITRIYEESFMRECMNKNEKQCVNKDMCECMFIEKGNQFIGTEFLLPNEKSGDVAQ
eukprot:625153-Rhodomonas_salina.1